MRVCFVNFVSDAEMQGFIDDGIVVFKVKDYTFTVQSMKVAEAAFFAEPDERSNEMLFHENCLHVQYRGGSLGRMPRAGNAAGRKIKRPHLERCGLKLASQVRAI